MDEQAERDETLARAAEILDGVATLIPELTAALGQVTTALDSLADVTSGVAGQVEVASKVDATPVVAVPTPDPELELDLDPEPPTPDPDAPTVRRDTVEIRRDDDGRLRIFARFSEPVTMQIDYGPTDAFGSTTDGADKSDAVHYQVIEEVDYSPVIARFRGVNAESVGMAETVEIEHSLATVPGRKSKALSNGTLTARLVLEDGSPAPVDAYPYTLARTVRGEHVFEARDSEDVRAELLRLHRESIDDVTDNGDGTWSLSFPPGREPDGGVTDLGVMS